MRRVADTSPRELGHLFEPDGRWRLYAFADAEQTAVRELAEWLEGSEDSPVRKFTPEGADINSVFDAEVIHQQPYTEVELADVPSFFLPKMGPYQLTDRDEASAPIPAPTSSRSARSTAPVPWSSSVRTCTWRTCCR